MIKRVIKYKSLPFEIGKTYVTKFSTGERFTITDILLNTKGEPIRFYGIYEKYPLLTGCSLIADRLIPEKIEDDSIEVCSVCGTPIE